MGLYRRIAPLLLIALLCLYLPVMGSDAGAVTGLVFVDRPVDGLYQEGEQLLDGVDIALMTLAGDAQVAVSTTQGGSYTFNNVPAGEYYLRFSLPEGHVPTQFHREGSLAIPSTSPHGRTAPFQVGIGVAEVYIGAMNNRQAGFVRAVAFGDDNLNGGRYSSEPLLEGVALEVLFELDGVFYQVGTASTDKEGVGTIGHFAPGTYVLGATMTGSYIIGPLGSKINLFYNTIVPSETNYGRSEPFELPLNGSVGMGVGGARTGSAQGFVWDDLSLDGRRDKDEPGAAGVEIILNHLTMGVERRMMTGPEGIFSFPKLQPGEYSLTASLGDDRMFTLPEGDSSLSSDTARSATRTIIIEADTQNDLGLVGVIPNTALWLHAYHDRNLNGIHDAEEPAFAGARLDAYAGEQLLASAETDAQGAALLPLLRGQPLRLTVTLPDGQIFSVPGTEGGNDFYAPTAESQLSLDYVLPPGQVSQVRAGVTLPASIGGVLYEDTNSNAVLDEGERFLSGFKVEALNAQGQVVSQAVTGEDGAYTLPRLVPGTYEVRLHLQTPYIFSSAPVSGGQLANRFTDQRADYGMASGITVQAGSANETVHGAVFRSGVVEGQVLLGDDLQGFDGNLGGLPGVLVTLLDEDGQEVSQYTVATTDSQGAFFLKGALPGTYSLRYDLPEDSAFSMPLTDDSSVTTPAFDIKASDELKAEPLYAVRTGSYQGTVYLDGNVNGQLDQADSPLAEAHIVLESAIPENTRETQSQPDGTYNLTGLRPGPYQLKVTLPEGMLVSFDQGSPLTPTTGQSNVADVAIAMGQQIQRQNIAVLPVHSLSGTLYYDSNLDRQRQPEEPGAPEVELRLRHQLSKIEFSAVSTADGTYSVPVLFPGSYTLFMPLPQDYQLYAPHGAAREGPTWSMTLELDPDESATLQDFGLVRFGSLQGQVWNLDGTNRDVEGLPITLLDGQGASLHQTTTAHDGSWRFEGLYPGDYMVRARLPEGFRFARELDSQHTRFSLITADGSTVSQQLGTSLAFELAMAEHKQAQDIGMGTLGRLGDFAWLDLDGDGMQDAGEPGVPGIQVRLYQYGQLAAEAVTDVWGRYLLEDLYPGQYTVEVTMHPELRATRQQNQFPLVASVLPQAEGTTVQVEGIVVPSGGRNLNCDFGFELVTPGQLPASMQQLPQRDWTPLVPTEPKRVR